MRILLTILFLMIATVANAQTCIGAPPLTQIIVDNTIDICLPTSNAQEISSLALRQTLKTMTSAIFQNGNISSGVIELTDFAPLAIVDLTTPLPVNGLYLSGSGAIFSVCPLTYGNGNCTGLMAVTYAAQYLKATATQPNTIAEYMVVNDCNLNAGRIGSTPGSFNDAKVCQYNSVVTGANASNSTWVQANNLEILAGDNVPPGIGLIPFKVNTELDVTNSGPDCAVGVRNCYNLYLSGNVVNPTTAFLAIAPTGGGPANAHFGILINGASGLVADSSDIEESGNAPVGVCIGCLLESTHSAASIRDASTTPTGLWLNGTYTNAIVSNGFSVNASGQVGTTSASVPGSGFLAVAVSNVVSPNLGIFFSDGTPSVSAADGSINLDTSGKLWLRTGGVWTQVTVP